MSQNESNFEANQELLQLLLSIGIAEHAAKEALFCTGNKSADDAINYIFNSDTNPHDLNPNADPAGQAQATGDATDDDEWVDEDTAYFKMTFVVNSSLKMGVGKVAAQVAHACLGLYREMLGGSLVVDLNQWEEVGEKKIVLKGSSTEQLNELYARAQEAKIPAYLVRDAGHTQIPRGSVTVLSLFGQEENVNKITGQLSLL